MEAVLFLDSKEETRPVDRSVSFEAILTTHWRGIGVLTQPQLPWAGIW